MNASVSVVIPAYQAEATIARALASVAAQTVRPAEAIVVDDGSRDRTAEIAESCRTFLGDINLIVVRQANKGAAAARNTALTHASAEFVAFLDSDDEWLPEKLERSLEILNQKDVVLVAHNGWIINRGAVTSVLDPASRFRRASRDLLHGLYRRGFIATSSVVTRRAAVIDAGSFDETLQTGQDFDLWLRMLSLPNAGFEVRDDILFRYHISPLGITANRKRRVKDTMTIAMRHAPRLKHRTGRYVISLWFRIIAIHAEALVDYREQCDYMGFLQTLATLPLQLLASTWIAWMPGRAAMKPAVFWLAMVWVVTVAAAYLWQYSPYAYHIMARLTQW